MADEPTCGKGLAANAILPASMGELLAKMADLLHEHQRALDLTDENARLEHAAYVTLVQELRALSGGLAGTAQRMAGYRDLPMGRHDEQQMASRNASDAFEQFVRAERAVLSLLKGSVDVHEAMLATMKPSR